MALFGTHGIRPTPPFFSSKTRTKTTFFDFLPKIVKSGVIENWDPPPFLSFFGVFGHFFDVLDPPPFLSFLGSKIRLFGVHFSTFWGPKSIFRVLIQILASFWHFLGFFGKNGHFFVFRNHISYILLALLVVLHQDVGLSYSILLLYRPPVFRWPPGGGYKIANQTTPSPTFQFPKTTTFNNGFGGCVGMVVGRVGV